ncbi:MAG: hypothetical protein M3453_02170 [Pseudomonadota bacterium]|nr:hypothetical protein [Pseudomonadota bacterium]
MTEPNLEFIGAQLERLAGDVAALRDDMAVLTAIVLRQDATQTVLLTEVRAPHRRIADRVRRLETHD